MTEKKILIAEAKLCSNIYTKFVGIDQLARIAGMSGTKFKNQFKLVYGSSPFQYYQSKQMLVARELLRDSNTSIGDIAKKFQYENTGKFSRAFKKKHGLLPSELVS